MCPATKKPKYGRAMSGVMVYVQHELMRHVKRLYQECDFGIILLFDKILFCHDKNNVVCFVYLPPEHSPFYDGREIVGISMLENLIFDFTR